MATMHDVLDAQWLYDNFKDGECLVYLRLRMATITRQVVDRQ